MKTEIWQKEGKMKSHYRRIKFTFSNKRGYNREAEFRNSPTELVFSSFYKRNKIRKSSRSSNSSATRDSRWKNKTIEFLSRLLTHFYLHTHIDKTRKNGSFVPIQIRQTFRKFISHQILYIETFRSFLAYFRTLRLLLSTSVAGIYNCWNKVIFEPRTKFQWWNVAKYS